MLPYARHQTRLLRFYQKYLDDLDTAGFIRQVSSHYRCSALHRIATHGDVGGRRAAVLALGFLADFSANAVVASLLRDADRGVRMLAKESIHNVWLMQGSSTHRQMLTVVRRYVCAGRWESAIEVANELTRIAPSFGEAWNEVAVIKFHLGNIDTALDCCQATISLNPFEYHALVGAGHCCIELGKPADALSWYHRALGVFPDLDQVRHEVQRLRRLVKRA